MTIQPATPTEVASSDFTSTTYDVTFYSDVTITEAWLTVIDDNKLESAETFTVTLSLASSGTCCLGDSASVDIVGADNDGKYLFVRSYEKYQKYIIYTGRSLCNQLMVSSSSSWIPGKPCGNFTL